MPEEYTGTKFHTIFKNRTIPVHLGIDELIEWGRRFDSKGLAPSYGTGSGGNLSFRISEGFIITSSHSHFGKLTHRDFVEVLGCDSDTIKVNGEREPSSETILHSKIYGARPDVEAVFHFHDDTILAKAEELGLVVTAEEHPYGTPQLADEVMSALGNNSFIVMKNHGCIALGDSIDRAGALSMETHEKATKTFIKQ